MIRPRSILAYVAPVLVLCGRAADAQNAGGEGTHSTTSLSTPGQSSEQLGTLWPGVSLSAGVSLPVSDAVAIRTEAMVAGFIAGGDVIADCRPGAPCLDQSTPGGIFGATISSSSRFALELRYDHPSQPIGLMNSTVAIGVRVRP